MRTMTASGTPPYIENRRRPTFPICRYPNKAFIIDSSPQHLATGDNTTALLVLQPLQARPCTISFLPLVLKAQPTFRYNANGMNFLYFGGIMYGMYNGDAPEKLLSERSHWHVDPHVREHGLSGDDETERDTAAGWMPGFHTTDLLP